MTPPLHGARRRRPISAASIPTRSRACAPRPGPILRTRTNCTIRSSGLVSSLKTKRRSRPSGSSWLEALARQKRTARLRAGNKSLWIAAERVPQFRALFPDATLDPPIEAPQAQQDQTWTREEALVEILRGRLEGQGPVAESALALPLGLPASEIAAALAALQTEGFAMRGRFSDPSGSEEWCERRLLARIHHYTVKRLRAEIEPVSARDFMRFLFAWQRVASARMEGPDALGVIIGQLEGFEAAAGAWESEILPARLKGYESDWLDDLCLAGRATWARLASASRARQRQRVQAVAGSLDADHASVAPPCRAVGFALAEA